MGGSVGQPPHTESLAFHKDKATYQCMEMQAAINMSCAPTPYQAGTFFPRVTLTRSSPEGKIRGHNHGVYASSFKFQSVLSVSSPRHLIRV